MNVDIDIEDAVNLLFHLLSFEVQVAPGPITPRYTSI